MAVDTEQFIEKANKRLEKLTIFALYANEHFRSVHDIQTLLLEHKDVFDMAGFFLQTSVNAHNTCIFLSISKMFCDSKEKSDNCLNLMKEMVERKEERFMQPFDVTKYESTLSEESHTLHFDSINDAYDTIIKERERKNKVIKRIRNLRNKYYAHMDLEESRDYTKLFRNNPVSMDELDELLNLNFTICNCINILLNDTTVMHDVVKKSSLDAMAKYAEKGRKTEEKEREEALQMFLNFENN